MTATQRTSAPQRSGPRHAARAERSGRLSALAGTYLPWATFVLNDGAYPAQSTLEFFTVPFGVTGFRLHLLLFGLAAIVLALVAAPGRGRMLRALGWGVVLVS